MNSGHVNNTLNAWLQLVRIPNLLTVPGDALAGFMLARFMTETPAPLVAAIPPAVAALLIYAAGLIDNDIVDLEEDRLHRPDRPLPAGMISRRSAIAAAAGLAVTGLLLVAGAQSPAQVAAIALVIMVALYNHGLKNVYALGPLSMGACRGLSLCLGAAATGWRPGVWDPVMAACAGLTLYVASVTSIARHETEPVAGTDGYRAWLPGAAITICFAMIYSLRRPGAVSVLLALFALSWTLRSSVLLHWQPGPETTGKTVGRMIRGLLPVQAALLALSPSPAGLCLAAAIMGLWPANTLLARRFKPS